MARTITKRFYMGAQNCEGYWRTLGEAIEQAKEYIENNPDCEERTVVEVVKIVRRQRQPIVVEDVR